MGKIKTLKVTCYCSDDTSQYGGMLFALCDKKCNAVTDFHLCREELIGELSECWIYKGSSIDFKKTRLMVVRAPSRFYSKRRIAGDVRTGLLLVRSLERAAGWKRSVLYKAELEGYDMSGLEAYVFVGDQRWQRSPSALSLYTLLIRLGRSLEFRKVRGEASFQRVCKSLINKHNVDSNTGFSLDDPREDIRQIEDKFEYFFPYVKNFKEIYRGLGPASVYSAFTESGIRDFIDLCWMESEAEVKAAKRFRSIMEGSK